MDCGTMPRVLPNGIGTSIDADRFESLALSRQEILQ
ncbi:hypothetical protein W823_12685 [Williamsia sp. D3]|jgi:hypothetical protein|nr:hypothetical protein W823_12685 [Williamsia sp. D3]